MRMNNLEEKAKEITPDDWKKIVSRGMWMGCGTILFIVFTMTSCTMHSNTYDPARLKEEAVAKQVEAEIERVKAETSKQQVAIRREQLKTLEKLVMSGVNPVAARCAIKGWSLNTEEMPCIIAAGQSSTIIKTESTFPND